MATQPIAENYQPAQGDGPPTEPEGDSDPISFNIEEVVGRYGWVATVETTPSTPESNPLAEAITAVLRTRYEADAKIGPLLAFNLAVEGWIKSIQEQVQQHKWVTMWATYAAIDGPQGIQTVKEEGMAAIENELQTHTSSLRQWGWQNRQDIIHVLGDALTAIARAKADRRWVLFRRS